MTSGKYCKLSRTNVATPITEPSRIENHTDGCRTYLHVSKPWFASTSPHALKDVIGHYRKIFNGFYIANHGYERETAEQEIEKGRADAVAFGKLFISNPDLPYRFENDLELALPDTSTYYTAGPKGYIDYPFYNEKSTQGH